MTRMDYPNSFPRYLQPPVDAAIAEAELLRIKLKTKPEMWQGMVFLYVKTIFFAFAEQACQAGRDDIWTGETIRKELEAYLRRIAEHAWKELAPNANEGTAENISAIVGSIKDANEWKALQEKLKDVATNRRTMLDAPPWKIKEPRKPPIHREPNQSLLKVQEALLTRPKAAEALGISLRQFDRLTKKGELYGTGPTSHKRYKAAHLTALLEKRGTRDRKRQTKTKRDQ